MRLLAGANSPVSSETSSSRRLPTVASPGCDAAEIAVVVPPGSGLVEAVRIERRGEPRVLVGADFEQQPAVRAQKTRRGHDDPPHEIQTIATTIEPARGS